MKKLCLLLAALLCLGVCAAGAPFDEAARKEAQKADLAFIWASDAHHQKSTGKGARFELIDAFVRSAGAAGAAFAAITGDLVNGGYNKAGQTEDILELCSWLKPCPVPVMLGMGNHDDNSWFVSGRATVKEIGSPGELMPKEDFYRLIFGDGDTDFVRDPENPYGGWFYKDFSKARIRVIMLNSADVPYIPAEEGLKYYGQWHYAFRQEQLRWLANKALRFGKRGWGVIIMSHVTFVPAPSRPDRTMPVNYELVNELIEAFKTGGRGTLVSRVEDHEVRVRYNFGRNLSRDYIASFAGHTHNNECDYLGGSPRIIIGNMFNRNRGGYDLVTVDRKKRTISLMRCIEGETAPQWNRAFRY